MKRQPPHWRTQFALDYEGEINVDLFAGGGGASTGLEMGLKRPVHVAINHDPNAISMHTANHPGAEHYQCDVYEVDPITATRGQPIGWLHASPDCTHHSQARGGQPRKRAIRSLSWVVHKWAALRPRIISLENVEQILQWGPLIAKRCKDTGRVMKADGTVAAVGERTPINEQFLVPDKKRRSQNWRHFIGGLRALGYTVEWRTIAACDFGAPTTRKRLYLIARRDGQPIVWPTPTHARKPAKGQKRYAAAASCMDWTDLGKSIFNRPRPLAENTLKRIAKGIDKFVIGSANPFIVPITDSPNIATPTIIQIGYGERKGQAPRILDLGKPLGTAVAGGCKFAAASPLLVQLAHGQGKPGGVQRWGIGSRDIEEPMNTITASGGMAVATAFIAQMNGGFYEGAGRAADDPLSTITGRGTQQQIVTAHLMVQRRNQSGADVAEPLHTITAGANHHGLVHCMLSPQIEESALQVAAFLLRYSTDDQRVGPVIINIKGTPYVIVDICLRMLKPRELYRAQGFPDSYIIDRGHDGRKFTITAQTKMCGNSVSPLPMAALAKANDHQVELNHMEGVA